MVGKAIQRFPAGLMASLLSLVLFQACEFGTEFNGQNNEQVFAGVVNWQCTEDDQCADWVCDTELAFCVPCLADDHCLDGEKCVNKVCVQPAEISSGECSSNADCKGATYCKQGSCVGLFCIPGAKTCYKAMAVKCNAEGSGFESVVLCDDGDECTVGDGCVEGECRKTSVKDCDDGNPCTSDDCDTAAGCLNEPNSLPCNDGSKCTTGDYCQNGQCVFQESTCQCLTDADCKQFDSDDKCAGIHTCVHGYCVINAATRVLCPESEFECHDNVCNPATGLCESVPSENGTSCDDDLPCTGPDACKNGVCTSEAYTCDDGNECTEDWCDENSGDCIHVATPGQACDDKNMCTSDSYCAVAGSVAYCAGTQWIECIDDNPCTMDNICYPASGCYFEQAVSGPCAGLSASALDDGSNGQ